MSQESNDDTIVPMPESTTENERQRIRESNDRDQRRERDHKPSRHNQGYDQAVNGIGPSAERPIQSDE